MERPPRFVLAQAPEQLLAAQTLFRQYAADLAVDLCFQGFEAELRELPGEYAAPLGGLWLAYVGEDAAGCVALRPLANADYPDCAEMKRLFVHPSFRGLGFGRLLVETALEGARMAGYANVLLDTLDDMEAARALYDDLGFEEIPPYYNSPIAGAHFLKVKLD